MKFITTIPLISMALLLSVAHISKANTLNDNVAFFEADNPYF